MSQDQFLTVADIVDELNAGKGIIKYILRKFKAHIPSQVSGGQDLYPVQALTVISDIMERINMGETPGRIANDFENPRMDDSLSPQPAGENQDIRISHDGLTLLRSLINDIGEQQKRIAMAHEKRAEAEERKAVAIEKRAEAEEKKAEAMNNIANALQEMNRLRVPIDPAAQQIAHEAVQVATADEQAHEIPEVESDVADILGTDFDDELSSMIDADDFLQDDFLEPDAMVSPAPVELDDLSRLIDSDTVTPAGGSDPLEDLSSLIDTTDTDPLQVDDLSALLDDDDAQLDTPAQDLDDLSVLIDDQDFGSPETLPDETPHDPVSEMDDLSKLIDTDSIKMSDNAAPVEMDDLSALIDEVPQPAKDTTDDDAVMDDLSLLIDAPDTEPESAGDSAGADIPMDDLSKLIDADDSQTDEAIVPEPSVKITIDASPEDVSQYKAAIMKTIMSLKNEGRPAEETTRILNENGIRTISGKPEWSQKAVAQIYGFIETAAG